MPTFLDIVIVVGWYTVYAGTKEWGVGGIFVMIKKNEKKQDSHKNVK